MKTKIIFPLYYRNWDFCLLLAPFSITVRKYLRELCFSFFLCKPNEHGIKNCAADEDFNIWFFFIIQVLIKVFLNFSKIYFSLLHRFLLYLGNTKVLFSSNSDLKTFSHKFIFDYNSCCSALPDKYPMCSLHQDIWPK